MTKSKKLLAFVMAIVVVISAFFIGDFFIHRSKASFQTKLTAIYQKYDKDFDKTLLDEDEFALSRLVAFDYNGKSYGEIDKAVEKNGFAVLQFESPSKARIAYDKMKADGITVDADGFAELDAYDVGEMHPIASDLIGTKQYVNNFKMAKEDVLVAVIDTGVVFDHPDLADRFYSRGYDFSSDGYADAEYDKNLETSLYFHSTFVCGIIANNTPSNVKFVPYKTVPFGAGDCEASAILASLNNAIELGVDVVNMSVSTYSSRNVLYSLVKKATQNGICICASAGNRGANVDSCPASFENTITVAALNRTCDKIASFSNYGNAVDFAAPGSHIVSTMIDENGFGYGEYSGTSFSAPYVTSACANIKSMNKNLSKDEVYQILCDFSVDMGDEGKDIYYGNGVPNLSNIVYTDNESYEYRLPQGELNVYSAKNYTEKTQPWKLFREKLISVNVNPELKRIGDYNFYGMNNADFNIGQLNSVGTYAFNGCTKLKNQAFDLSVQNIGAGAYGNIRNDFSISGYRNTPAERYALDENIGFNSLGCNHSYSREIVEPEIDREGYTIYTCLVCGDEYIGAYIEPEVIESGFCGDNVEYDLYNTGRLVIKGSGDMYLYDDEESPFYDFKNDITNVYFDGNVTSVSPFAFSCCPFIKSFNSFTDSIKIIDNSVYSSDEKTLFYAFSNDYEMPKSVENFNASAFINSSVDVNSNFDIDNGLVYDKNHNVVMALPSYNENVLTIDDNIVINDFAFVLTSYPESLRAYSENISIGKYAIGYSYKNGLIKNDFSYYGYDNTNGFSYALENGFSANSLNSGKCGENLYWHFDMDNGELRIYGSGAMNRYSTKDSIPWYDYTSQLKSIVIEDDVESLSIYSFFDKNNVKSITLPASLNPVISQTVWFGCSNVESIVLTKGNGEIPDYGNNNRSSVYTYSPWYPSRNNLKSITVSENVERIGKYAFRGCNALKELVLNDCVEISECAFYDASNLESITNYSKSTLYSDKSFTKASSNLTLYGYSDSTTKDIAQLKNINFVSIGCEHSRGYIEYGERAVCCYDSDVEYRCVDCDEILYNEYIESKGNGHFVKVTVLTANEKPIENADVYLDGVLSAKTNRYGKFVLDEVKCEITHIIEIKKYGSLIATTNVETNSSNRMGDMIIHYGDFVKDSVINAKDYAYALKNHITDKDMLDYGKITDDILEVDTKYSNQYFPNASNVYNEQNDETQYKRDFIAEVYPNREYILKEAGFIYGKDMDDEFMLLENVGKSNKYSLTLKKSTCYEDLTSTYRVELHYGAKAMDGKVSARFYYIYSNGVKDYVAYSDISSYVY